VNTRRANAPCFSQKASPKCAVAAKV
jgi:hypothetical protein